MSMNKFHDYVPRAAQPGRSQGAVSYRILRKPATVLAQPKASSTRLRMRWETAYPG